MALRPLPVPPDPPFPSRSALRLVVLLWTLLLGIGKNHAQPATPQAQDVTPDTFSGVERIVAIGDIHGDHERFLATLKLCRIIDDKQSWIGGKTHLVQTGDILDRGPDSKKVIDLLMQLEEQAKKTGGKVHALIGNHEYMTIAGDLRYVSDGELAAFGDGPRLTPVGREPACSVAKYRAAFGPQSKYGRWILSHNAIVKVNDTVFMHGGLSPRYLHRKLNDLNRAVRTELQNPSPQSFGVGSDPEGPLWFRGLAESLQEQVQSAYLKELATSQGAGRIVMGHTIQDKGISLRADGKIALIDVGMSRWTLGGAPSCLVIERSGNTDRLSILR
ncbi:MAG TPA: metallophosphoesterase [Pseudomonadota bacterium]|nr:metallophosphoesterase [Pseudomonadota bacterium]HNN50528.1 metallophosphoesterase [Pseudomonadota bacterium]HNO68332.1 metallophosphoesterase [Pseudomonadota bacterium]